MKKALCIMALGWGLSMGAYAADWSGKLIDAACNDTKEQTKVLVCNATNSTTAFALDTAAKIYKLDPVGNAKAVEALKVRLEKPMDPAKATEAVPVKAKIIGTEKGGQILVDSIELQ